MTKEWSQEDVNRLYKIDRWSSGYFGVNEWGNICVRPSAQSEKVIDLKRLVDELRTRQINPPILIRFMDILRDRIVQLYQCFEEAIKANDYRGPYLPLFPIKVNQERDVVTSMLAYGKPFNLGLEAGSKAELLIVLALSLSPETPIVCNGYKDQEFAQLVCLAHKMGKKIFSVIENIEEVETYIREYKRSGVMPNLGVRIKITTKGVGKWARTSGDSSKFGLRIPELMHVIRRLREENLLDSLTLLHFHIGSQITEINAVKKAIIETMRVFVEMVKLGANLKYVDIGGGMGVDYDGSSGSDSTINYSIEEYASDVVYRIKQICDEHKLEHPTIFSESGRFLTAHYSMLVTNIPAKSEFNPSQVPERPKDQEFGPLQEMFGILDNMKDTGLVECYHDAIQYRNQALNLFSLGYLSLTERATMEDLYWHILYKIRNRVRESEVESKDLRDLETQLADMYFANFSLFQSLPDAWAIDQVFPIMPIHRLNEMPTRRGIIADLTCDSDGVIGAYVGEEGLESSLKLHEIKPDEPYYIGIFLIGAYQETLGELHNLFGDTHAVLIDIVEDGQYRIRRVLKGDTIFDVMGYVTYSRRELINNMREQMEHAVDSKRLDLNESARLMGMFEDSLHGYTYFED